MQLIETADPKPLHLLCQIFDGNFSSFVVPVYPVIQQYQMVCGLIISHFLLLLNSDFYV